jgi:hypothetical protein
MTPQETQEIIENILALPDCYCTRCLDPTTHSSYFEIQSPNGYPVPLNISKEIILFFPVYTISIGSLTYKVTNPKKLWQLAKQRHKQQEEREKRTRLEDFLRNEPSHHYFSPIN